MAAKWLQVDNVDATNECVNCAIPEKKLKKKKKIEKRLQTSIVDCLASLPSIYSISTGDVCSIFSHNVSAYLSACFVDVTRL